MSERQSCRRCHKICLFLFVKGYCTVLQLVAKHSFTLGQASWDYYARGNCDVFSMKVTEYYIHVRTPLLNYYASNVYLNMFQFRDQSGDKRDGIISHNHKSL